MGKSESPKSEWDAGFLNLGHSNWKICSLWSWFCSKKIPTSRPLCCGSNIRINTPGRGRKEATGEENGEKGQKWLIHRGFSAWDIQTSSSQQNMCPRVFLSPCTVLGKIKKMGRKLKLKPFYKPKVFLGKIQYLNIFLCYPWLIPPYYSRTLPRIEAQKKIDFEVGSIDVDDPLWEWNFCFRHRQDIK